MRTRVRSNFLFIIVCLFFLLSGGSRLFGKLGFQASLGLVGNDGVDHPSQGIGFKTNIGKGFGCQFGLVYCRDIGAHQILRVDALYALKGDATTLKLWIVPTGKINQEPTMCSIRAQYHYFEIPLLLENYFSHRKQGFHLLVGLYAAYLLKASMSGLEGDNWKYFLYDYSAVKRYDFGWIIGFGTKAKNSRRWRENFQVKVERGMVDIALKDFKRGYPHYGSTKNLTLMLTLSFTKGGSEGMGT